MFSLNHWHFFSRDFWVKWQLNIMEHKSISKHQLQGRLEGKVRKFSHMCRLSVATLNLSPCSPQSFELKMWNGRGETCLFSIRPSNLCSRKHFIKIIHFYSPNFFINSVIWSGLSCFFINSEKFSINQSGLAWYGFAANKHKTVASELGTFFSWSKNDLYSH